MTFDKNGKMAFIEKASVYQNEYDIKVTRLNYKKPTKIYRKLKKYIGTYEALELSKPDILFIHGCQFLDIKEVVKYLRKHSNVKVYVDNHADFSNSATNFISKNFLHKIIWRNCAQKISPYTIKFYGVLPARVDFLQKIYRIPKEKCELLVMGADDDIVNKVRKEETRKRIREKYKIKNEDFLIVTGGKIDPFKLQTLLLMEVIKKMNNNIKLLIFGSVDKKIEEKFNELCMSEKIQYVGWANNIEAYEYFYSADLVFFPGRHSVYWEQVVSLGIPMVCKYWEGTTHIDIGGNVKFLKEDSIQEIEKIIYEVLDNNTYEEMKRVADSEKRKKFLYSVIAKESIKEKEKENG